MSKIAMMVAAGAGYVLGARDGRERYEQIRQRAESIWQDPKVQQKKDQATAMAKRKGAELGDAAQQDRDASSPLGESEGSPASNGTSSAGSSATGGSRG